MSQEKSGNPGEKQQQQQVTSSRGKSCENKNKPKLFFIVVGKLLPAPDMSQSERKEEDCIIWKVLNLKKN
jgi:hypothetical protein